MSLCGNISTPKQIDSCNRINFDQLTEYLETLDSLLNKLLASSTDTCGSVRIIRYHLRINALWFIVDYTPLMRLFCWTAAASTICEATMLESLRYPLYCTALRKTLQLGILILLQKQQTKLLVDNQCSSALSLQSCGLGGRVGLQTEGSLDPTLFQVQNAWDLQ